VQYRFQNSKPGESISYLGHNWFYLSFIYEGAAKNRTGDNLEAALLLASNAISMNYATEAVQNKWNVRIDSCSMHPTTFAVGRTLTTEYWIAAGMSYDMQAIEILLSSSIDAVGASAPTRSLTKLLVGSIPVTGTIQNR
jgi:hypothetical protein